MSGTGRGKGRPLDVSATLPVRVAPRSAREEVAGVTDGVVRIRLTAPPVEDRANEALVAFLSRVLGVPRRRVEMVTGERGRRKVVRVHGLTRDEIYRRLGLEPAAD